MGTEFVLPVATLVEVGRQIGHLKDGKERREFAEKLRTVVLRTLKKEVPWAFHGLDWDDSFLREVFREDFVDLLTRKSLQMGDLAILAELRRLRSKLSPQVVKVGLWTLDSELEAAAAL